MHRSSRQRPRARHHRSRVDRQRRLGKRRLRARGAGLGGCSCRRGRGGRFGRLIDKDDNMGNQVSLLVLDRFEGVLVMLTHRNRIPTPNLRLDREQIAQHLFQRFLLFSHLSELLHVTGDFGGEEFLELFDVDYRMRSKRWRLRLARCFRRGGGGREGTYD